MIQRRFIFARTTEQQIPDTAVMLNFNSGSSLLKFGLYRIAEGGPVVLASSEIEKTLEMPLPDMRERCGRRQHDRRGIEGDGAVGWCQPADQVHLVYDKVCVRFTDAFAPALGARDPH